MCACVRDVLARGRDGARERDRECVDFAHDILDDFLLRVCVREREREREKERVCVLYVRERE